MSLDTVSKKKRFNDIFKMSRHIPILNMSRKYLKKYIKTKITETNQLKINVARAILIFLVTLIFFYL